MVKCKLHRVCCIGEGLGAPAELAQEVLHRTGQWRGVGRRWPWWIPYTADPGPYWLLHLRSKIKSVSDLRLRPRLKVKNWYSQKCLSSEYCFENQASLVTTYAALRPRDGFCHPYQEHERYFYFVVMYRSLEAWSPGWSRTRIKAHPPHPPGHTGGGGDQRWDRPCTGHLYASYFWRSIASVSTVL